MHSTGKNNGKHYLMHALQTVVANFKSLNDFHFNLHELNVLNLLTNNYIVKIVT